MADTKTACGGSRTRTSLSSIARKGFAPYSNEPAATKRFEEPVAAKWESTPRDPSTRIRLDEPIRCPPLPHFTTSSEGVVRGCALRLFVYRREALQVLVSARTRGFRDPTARREPERVVRVWAAEAELARLLRRPRLHQSRDAISPRCRDFVFRPAGPVSR